MPKKIKKSQGYRYVLKILSLKRDFFKTMNERPYHSPVFVL